VTFRGPGGCVIAVAASGAASAARAARGIRIDVLYNAGMLPVPALPGYPARRKLRPTASASAIVCLEACSPTMTFDLVRLVAEEDLRRRHHVRRSIRSSGVER
jgi:hypothetical protein